jgi:L-methionine (R)-S-oxide reductase
MVIEQCGQLPEGLAIEQRMRAVADLLWEAFCDQGVSWVGFYASNEEKPEDARLELVACRDKPACSPIGLGGVCGKAYTTGRAQIVDDVRELGEAYIACDPRDLSEIVIPFFGRGASEEACVGVLDLDSYETKSFDIRDQEGLCGVLSAAPFRMNSSQ